MATWVVPGAPLDDGAGWRIWYSKPGTQEFQPEKVTVTRSGKEVAVDLPPAVQLPRFPEVKRRMAVQEVRLATADPAGNTYRIQVPETGRTYSWRTLPSNLENPVTFFISSCFWRDNDKEGAYGAGMRTLTKLHHPHFKLLIGDQVYQDWPPAPLTGRSSAELYGDRYGIYWGDAAYHEVFTSSPNYFLCDDHEFWNDYPERQAQLMRTWKKRDEYGKVAQTLYDLFQNSANGGGKPWRQVKIGPVGIFLCDTRSQRTHYNDEPKSFIPAEQWTDLKSWFDTLEGPGLLVLGQPLFQKDGDFKDHSLSNFKDDYGRLCDEIVRTVKGERQNGSGPRPPHDVMVLTGDIHRGRFSAARFAGIGAGQMYEFVASPASRIGPYIKTPDPEPPPGKLLPVINGREAPWEVDEDEGPWTPMIDNNVGVVKMSTGTSGRIRFELSIWRHRPYDDRNFWERTIRSAQPQGDIKPLYKKEIELR